MKYFKLILDDKIVGAVTSNDFISYSPITDSFLRSNETEGEYISYNGNLYRATWMASIRAHVNYIEVFAYEITEEEYNIYAAAIESNEEVFNYQQEEIVEPEPFVNPVDASSLDFIKESKISEMSLTCRRTIEAGFDLEVRGELHHFSLDTQDQLNLISLSAIAQTQDLIPYHADGEECCFYTAAEINSIVAAATQFKIYHTTYYNALKNYINALDTIEEISAITYGVPIPEEYQSDVLKTLIVE